MRLGIIGLPGSGKTTVFNAIAGAHASVGYGQPGEIHRAVVKIPDQRLDALFELLQSKKKIHAEIEYMDFPPPDRKRKDSELVFPPDLRECDGIIAVINCFDPIIDRPPRERLLDLQNDMILSDLIVAEKRQTRLQKDSSRGVACDPTEIKAIDMAVEYFETEKPLRLAELSDNELMAIKGYAFLSLKPLLVVLNTAEGEKIDQGTIDAITADPTVGTKSAVTVLSGKVEMELADLDEADRESFLVDFGISEPATDKLVRMSYELLDLITFFTGAEKESRAWPVKRGSTAPEAAGHIHQDFQRGFIRAEVASVHDFIKHGGMANCRKAGVARLEGKEYIVQDGDYILFRFNV